MRLNSKVMLLLAATSLISTGCYAKKKDVEAEFVRVRQEMASMDQKHTDAENGLNTRIGNVEREVQRLAAQLNDLNVKVTHLNGLIAFHVPVHFDYDKADLRDADRAVLKRFASVVKEFYPSALITAEGYADPAGSDAYNQKLGMRRADAVRSYLTSDAGMSTDRVRTVSYGEAKNRLILPKAKGPGDEALPNRRVVLVFDYVGTAAAAVPVITN